MDPGLAAYQKEKYTRLKAKDGSGYMRFENIVSFGDAASDIGNYEYLAKNKKLINYSQPKQKGGKKLQFYNNGRLSEGKIWIDYLGDAFGAQVRSRAYAYSTTNMGWLFNGNKRNVPGLYQQVQRFASESMKNQLNPNSTLYTIWGGANDLFSVSISKWHKKSTPDKAVGPKQVMDDMIKSIRFLIEHPNIKAKNILFLTVLPVDKAPIIDQVPNEIRNKVLQNLETLKSFYKKMEFKDTNFVLYDANEFLSKMYKNHKDYGIPYSKHPCIASLTRKCTTPHEFFWYDNSHIGSTTHLHLALDIIKKKFGNAIVG
ncbi:hypothetical protein BB558_005594 [Smittium angustum]|uniref:SGNH hydrolase-type esterase domain-containing protein n=1 Tax=Smittium angustum TaxID=133377 RepID=A0A2U1J016_SMIAN|nr:hypothetical protein BB558_005594 [Smittium angustum]